MKYRRKEEDLKPMPEIPEDHVEDAVSFLENTRVLLKNVRGILEDDENLTELVITLENGLRDLSVMLGADWLDVGLIESQLKILQETLTFEVRLELENRLSLSGSPHLLD